MSNLGFSDVNIARRLTEVARLAPDRPAIYAPARIGKDSVLEWKRITFGELEEQTNRLAAGLRAAGAGPGTRLVLFVPFSIEFIALTFAMLKAGVTLILIDPGMGRSNIFKCLNEVRPDGFVAIPLVHLVRLFSGKTVRQAKLNFSVGPWLPGVTATYRSLMKTSLSGFEPVRTKSTDSAAIIFTSGSTGPPKGVQYEQGMFDAQVELIRDRYGIQPGEVDLPGFPLFGLFNAAMGVTTVIPAMDPTRPAQVNPRQILSAFEQHQVTQAFGSPAFWNRVGRYCEEHSLTLPTLHRALSAGGPVPEHVLRRMNRILTRPGADLFTPYGATESLPVSSIGASEILQSTIALTRQGKGTCVGKRFERMAVKIVPITDGPIASLAETQELPTGEIGEIIVSGPSVTREYALRPEATRLAKIPDGERFWHRIGDVGYFDEEGMLWFCGRKAHVVETGRERLFSVCCEAIFNQHPNVFRSALVGVGRKGEQRPVLVAEPEKGEFPWTPAQQQAFKEELLALGKQNPRTVMIREILFHPGLPVDTRHNVKINREALAPWAEERLSKSV